MSMFEPEIKMFKAPYAIFVVEKTMLVFDSSTLWPSFSSQIRRQQTGKNIRHNP